jgi:DNA-binding XRE family transcriptional regulator
LTPWPLPQQRQKKVTRADDVAIFVTGLVVPRIVFPELVANFVSQDTLVTVCLDLANFVAKPITQDFVRHTFPLLTERQLLPHLCGIYPTDEFLQVSSLGDMDDLRDLFATNLRRLRHERGLSQDDVSAAAEMDRSYLSEIENGKYHVSLKIVAKLSRVLEVEPAEFFRQPGHVPRGE